jgi:bacterioferritin (cytochrome b1)
MGNVAISADHAKLGALLRVELTAVHQQFFHALALRQWHETAIVDRLMAVDVEDFKNAMQIIDQLVAEGCSIYLESHRFTPGSDVVAVLRAEHQLEVGFAEFLGGVSVSTSEARSRVNRATAPRRAYQTWLENELAKTSGIGVTDDTGEAVAKMMAHLISLIEQAMVHAFVLWHKDDRLGADLAWKISGAAMLYATAIVRCGALENRVPVPAPIPAVEPDMTGKAAFDRDIELLNRCAVAAKVASIEQSGKAMSPLCSKIVEDCERILPIVRGQDFPAELGKSPAFASFAATRDRKLG